MRESTRTTSRGEAQEYEEKLRRDLRKQVMHGKKPSRMWPEAEREWLKERKHKRSILQDVQRFEYLQKFLQNHKLEDIDNDVIKKIIEAKEKEGVKPNTINRYLELIRAVLNCAKNDWKWIHAVPKIKLQYAGEAEPVWLKREQADRLIEELSKNPLTSNLRDMVIFALATGLREANITQLKWDKVDLKEKLLWVKAIHYKGKKAFGIPLNKKAIEILNKRKGEHNEYVFTYKGRPVAHCNNSAWIKAVERAGLNIRFHDLRHTWASWHVQSGTTLQELQELGGWSSYKMVLRYAHLSKGHLQLAADRI